MDCFNLVRLPITTKAVSFCRMLNVLKSLRQIIDPEQTVAVCFCANILVNNLKKYAAADLGVMIKRSFWLALDVSPVRGPVIHLIFYALLSLTE